MKNFDFDAARVHLSKQKKLGEVIDSIILPEREHTDDLYLGLIRSIVSQQLSVKAANTIYNRFLDLFVDRYPHSNDLLNKEDDVLRSVGMSRQKTQYVKNVAQFFKDKDLFNKKWEDESNESIIKLLTEIKGVGQWTVEMILMFVLSRQDILPVLDLGIQQAMIELYGIKDEKKALHQKMEKISKPWKPYRSIACLYLWAMKDSK